MLSFMLWPLRITRHVEIEDDRPHRSIRFDTRMNTRSERWKENTISDNVAWKHIRRIGHPRGIMAQTHQAMESST